MSRLLPLLVASFTLLACMTAPFDGQRVGASTSPVTFEGQYSTSGATVTLEALNTTTGAFDAVTTATVSSSSPVRLWDNDWFSWSRSSVLPSAYWTPGRTGFSAKVRARSGSTSLLGLQEGWDACLGRTIDRTVNDFATECTGHDSPVVTICTSDFSPLGSRRGPCPRRTVDVLDATGATARRYGLPDSTFTFAANPAPRVISWRGDRVTMLDVFDASPSSSRDVSRVGTSGLAWGNFVRLRYPNATTSTAFARFDVDSLAASLGTTLPWGGAVAIRQYDNGECSAFRHWRVVLDTLVPTLETSLRNLALRGHTIDAVPLSRTVLTPVIRTSGGDGAFLTQSFTVRGDGLYMGRLMVKALVIFGASRGRLIATVQSVDATMEAGVVPVILQAFGVIDVASLETEVEDMVRTLVPTLVADAIPLPVVQRVYGRPDGLEVVLADDPRDPLLPALRSAGFCNRPDPAPGGNQSGYFDSLFDPPLRGDPPVFGDPGRP